MDRMEEQARNHRVLLIENPAEEGERYEGFPPGATIAKCECQEVWEPPRTRTGNLTHTWWLCPRRCNLSEKVANKILRELEDGRREPDQELAWDCVQYLRDLTNPKRRESWRWREDDVLSALLGRIERSAEWKGRHSEWEPDLAGGLTEEEAWGDFE